MSQPTISSCVFFQTLDSHTRFRILHICVTFPVHAQELGLHQRRVYETENVPDKVGVIYGTHIQIQAPSVNENEFVNRIIATASIHRTCLTETTASKTLWHLGLGQHMT